MILNLPRDLSSPQCTLGTIVVGSLTIQTLERPWVPDPRGPCGHPDLSCVPAGTYDLVCHDSPKHPRSFALVNHALGVYHTAAEIPAGQIGRCEVLLHTGNTVEQSLACILVATTRLHLGDAWVVGRSKDAYEALMALLPWVNGMHQLVIEYSPGVNP